MKTLRDLRMDGRDMRRMPLGAGLHWWVAPEILDEAAELSRRAFG